MVHESESVFYTCGFLWGDRDGMVSLRMFFFCFSFHVCMEMIFFG